MAYFEVNKKPPLSFPSVSGAICTFNSQYSGLPLKAHEVAITAIQSGSGTPSPSNPRAISGHASVTISHSDADTSNPTKYTRSFGQTVYGGVLNCLTGVVSVTHGIYILTGNENWFVAGNGTNIRAYVDNLIPNKKYSANGICNYFKEGSANYPNEFDLVQNYTRFNIYGIATTGAEFNTWITNHSPITVIYELATPTTIQLTPIQVETLLGENNVWADTGDTSLQYIKLG